MGSLGFNLVSAGCMISFGCGLPSKRKDTLCSNSNNQKALTRLNVSVHIIDHISRCHAGQHCQSRIELTNIFTCFQFPQNLYLWITLQYPTSGLTSSQTCIFPLQNMAVRVPVRHIQPGATLLNLPHPITYRPKGLVIKTFFIAFTNYIFRHGTF